MNEPVKAFPVLELVGRKRLPCPYLHATHPTPAMLSKIEQMRNPQSEEPLLHSYDLFPLHGLSDSGGVGRMG